MLLDCSWLQLGVVQYQVRNYMYIHVALDNAIMPVHACNAAMYSSRENRSSQPLNERVVLLNIVRTETGGENLLPRSTMEKKNKSITL